MLNFCKCSVFYCIKFGNLIEILEIFELNIIVAIVVPSMISLFVVPQLEMVLCRLIRSLILISAYIAGILVLVSPTWVTRRLELPKVLGAWF
jgi:hypothetical protein